MTVAEIWQAIGASRAIGRTTVLNQVDRLEKRGWLRRVAGEGATPVSRFALPRGRLETTGGGLCHGLLPRLNRRPDVRAPRQRGMRVDQQDVKGSANYSNSTAAREEGQS